MPVIGHGVEICTSTTRPTPISGSLIYETDTQKMMLWDGSSWVTPMNLQSAGGDLTGTYPNPTISNNLNYCISNASAVTVSTSNQTVASASMYCTGRPVFVFATGDMNPLGAGTWGYFYLYMDSSQIGKYIICESTANTVNNPFALSHILVPSAGNHTFSLVSSRGGNYNYIMGETGNGQAATVGAFELR